MKVLKVEKVDSPIGDENCSCVVGFSLLVYVEKVDSPIGDENKSVRSMG